MWIYEKKLEYPVRVSGPNPKLAKAIITQYGGPDGELAASLRYLTQRYTMPTSQGKGLLTDIGTEELAHMEIVAALVYNLIKDASISQIKAAGLEGYYADHDRAVYFVNGEGVPGQLLTSNPKAIRSRICTRIWLQKKKPVQLMSGSLTSLTILMLPMFCASSGSGKSSTSSGLANCWIYTRTS